MASSMARILDKSLIISNAKYMLSCSKVKYSSIPPKKKRQHGTIKHRNLISSARESLASRGFLRSYKPYHPAENVRTVVSDICQRVLGPDFATKICLTREEKFNLLNTCNKELNHCVPSSLLHTINNHEDVIKFYETPVSTTVPYDDLVKKTDLPPNLHIQKDYLRFNPETDILFEGISAFPESSTIVTGLKAKKKYKGYKAKAPDVYCNDAHYTKTNVFE